jgi:hypothetical protein
MEGDRVVLKISSQTAQGSEGEKMIWWKPTIENARALVEIYDQKIQGKYGRSLTFVPTIEHGKLIEQGMVEKYGEGKSHFVHSQMSDEEIHAVLERHEKEGGNLTSVKMISRGYRGTGTGGVFHTYQSSSSELVAQRTGRAWGVREGENYPDLYVLEAAWSERDSFATLARLCGLIETPLEKFSTRGLKDAVLKIKRRKKLEEERGLRIEQGEATPFFKNVPLAEEWRTLIGEILKHEGGVSSLSEKTGLSPEVIAGLALGSLPTEWADVARLQVYLGGEERRRPFG